MEAGRELDALVAEKVMGLPIEGTKLSQYSWTHPPYSTDIAAAWEVAEAAKLFTKKMLVLAHDGRNWIVCEEVTPSGPHHIYGSGDTAPLAICKAALEAIGSE